MNIVPVSSLYTSSNAVLSSPYYSGGQNNSEQGAVLQRYFVPEFIQRFQRDLQEHQLDSPSASEWKAADRFSDYDNKVVLRLPIHKSFYVFSCEIGCNQLGSPALDPQKISSAGIVIRRLANGIEQSWMVEEDEPLGWQESPTGLRDPDVHRRLCRDGSLHPREDVSTYTGEQTHPVHPVKVKDENGKCHTVLFGYVPLGGSYLLNQNDNSPFDNESLQAFNSETAQHLPWPYGERGRTDYAWANYSRPITNGRPSKEFFELLRLLLNRYHLGEAGIEENDALQELTEGIYFYDQARASPGLSRHSYLDHTRDFFTQGRKFSLWSWLQSNFAQQENKLIAWMAQQEKDIAGSGAILTPVTFDSLPSKPGRGTLRYSLYITRGDARDFRNLLNQRVLSQALAVSKEIPLPKFQQGEEDVYQIIPFARVKDDSGNKEYIIWGNEQTRSEEFRVAAPFDPLASRPSLIQMPSLKDLKKGLAGGVGMITPPDTFNLLNALNLKKGASEDVIPSNPPGGIGVQWICSFSLPVITLVAMILLMIMISLLNIIFFWLPWVKICLPFPKAK